MFSRVKSILNVGRQVLSGDHFIPETTTRKSEQFRLNNKVFFATYHKAGTVWFSTILEKLAKSYGFGFRMGNRYSEPVDEDVFFCDHSHFAWDQIPRNAIFIHLVRDPRDMLVSACFYHLRAKEKWLYTKNPELEGMSYREALLKEGTLEDQLRFVMKRGHLATTNDMKAWDYQMSNCMEIRYEDYIVDYELERLLSLFRFMGIPGHAIGNALTIAYQTSLFPQSRHSSEHIRSGVPGDWKKHFTRDLAHEFNALHGDFLIKLGYERDHSWVENFSETAPSYK